MYKPSLAQEDNLKPKFPSLQVLSGLNVHMGSRSYNEHSSHNLKEEFRVCEVFVAHEIHRFFTTNINSKEVKFQFQQLSLLQLTSYHHMCNPKDI